MALSPERKKRLTALFKDEVGEHLRKLSSLLLELEKGPGEAEIQSIIEEVFRSFHTIKGSAKVLNVAVIQAIAHLLEDLFTEIRKGSRKVHPGYIDVSFDALDSIMACLEQDLQMSVDDPTVVAVLRRIEDMKRNPPKPGEARGRGRVAASDADGDSPQGDAAGAVRAALPAGPGRGDAPATASASGDAGISSPAPVGRRGEPGAPGAIESPGAVRTDTGLPSRADPGGPARAEPGGQPGDQIGSRDVAGLPSRSPATGGATRGDPGSAGRSESAGQARTEPGLPSRDEAGGAGRQDALAALRGDAPEPGAGRGDAPGGPRGGQARGDTGSTGRGDPGGPARVGPKRGADGKKLLPSERLARRTSYETIRVNTEKLDSLMNKVGELVISKIKGDQRLKEIREMSTLVVDLIGSSKLLRAALPTVPSEGSGAVYDSFHQLEEKFQDLERKVSALQREFSNDVDRMGLVSRDIEDDIRSLRLLPISDLVDPYYRMVRDLARELGRKIALRVDGGDTEVDKEVLEGLRDPLLHLLRNAIDHGIEGPEERRAAGKPEEGTIRVGTFQRGMSIQMTLADDGRGIDPERIREAVVRKGLAAPDRAASFSREQLFSLLFEPGFSTRNEVTEVSGRGVGLDVVRENLASFNGSIEIQSEVGKGTTFILKLPLTLITTQALLVRVGKQVLAIPSIAVQRTLEIDPVDVRKVDRRHVLMLEGKPVVYSTLATILASKVPPRSGSGKIHVVVLSDGSRHVALQTDMIEGEQAVVHKSLGANFIRVRNVAGATILGTGKVVIMLNPADLIRGALGVNPLAVDLGRVEDKKARILLVEDSFATRSFEQEILESAGFEVVTAADGMTALDILAEETFDGVVTDIEMPRLDGLRLTRRIKSNARTKDLPVIIVSSLSAEDARDRGLEVGADAYVAKGEFERDNFIKMLRDLVGP